MVPLPGRRSLAPSPSASPSFKAKQPARRSKRKPTAKPKLLPVKTEEAHPSVHIKPALDEAEAPRKGRDVRSMAPPPTTPAAPPKPLRSRVNRRLPTTPRIDVFVETEAVSETGDAVDVHGVARPPEATPTPPEVAVVTSHQAHEMLRNLTTIIDAASLNPEEHSSILHRAKALTTILDTTILPRMMKVDKEVKDLVWMRWGSSEHYLIRSLTSAF